MLDRNSFKIGTFLGIPVYIHWSWILILTFFSMSIAGIAESQIGITGGLAYAVGLVAALLAFASLLAHEYGHAMMARFFGIGTERISLFLLGGVAQIKEEPRQPHQELLVALAGPAVSIVCFVGFLVLYFLAGGASAETPLAFVFQQLWSINLVFAVFNMIPGFPMDGGRVLRAGLWLVTGNYLLSTRIATTAGKGFGWLLMGTGIFLLFTGAFQGIILILLGYFLSRLAATSYRQAQFKSAFDRVYVRDIMRPVQAVVPAGLPVRSVVEDYIYKIHSDRFPVVQGDSLLGYISADDITALDRSEWDRTVAERLVRPFSRREILDPHQDALAAFQKVSFLGRNSLPVFENRRLVGYLFLQDVANYLGAGRRGG